MEIIGPRNKRRKKRSHLEGRLLHHHLPIKHLSLGNYCQTGGIGDTHYHLNTSGKSHRIRNRKGGDQVESRGTSKEEKI